MRRFERIYNVVEPVEEYRKGGYHPVHLEDIFHDRYQVIGKLAYGQFSTVWLSRDFRTQRLVTLKILKAEASRNTNELSILLHLSESGPEHPGQKHVMQLLDHFLHDGPNGTHLCLVFPVMVSDGHEMTIRQKSRQPEWARAISRQIILGLDFLHEQGIIHCDLQPANILFSVDISASSDMPMEQPEFSPVQWLPNVKSDDSAPQYLVTSQRPRGVLDDTDFNKLSVKIGDFGGASWRGQYGFRPVTPRALRPPELIEGHPWNSRIDIWTLGCLLYQLITNQVLFPVMSFGLTSKEADYTLKIEILKMTKDDNQKEFLIACLSESLSSDFGPENVERFAIFLSSMLKSDPKDRECTTELLKNPFLIT